MRDPLVLVMTNAVIVPDIAHRKLRRQGDQQQRDLDRIREDLQRSLAGAVAVRRRVPLRPMRRL